MARSPAAKPAFPWTLLWVFLAVLAGVAAVGVWSVVDRRDALFTQARNELSSIADLKSLQITRWLEERKADGLAMQSGPVARRDVPALVSGAGGKDVRLRVEEWLRSILSSYPDYDGIFLLDGNGEIVFSEAAEGISFPGEDKELVLKSAKEGSVVVTDMHEANGGRPHIGLIVPIGEDEGHPAQAVVVAWINPERYLFPLMQLWPVPSLTGETLLVKGEGESVLFLNELRHRKGTALKMRLPLAKSDLPAAMAVGGASGAVRGRDYRGKPVLAFLEAVAGTDWHLVAKLDETEIVAPLWRTVPLIVGATLALALAALMGTFLLWRRREARFFEVMYLDERKRFEAEEALRRREETFAALANQVPGMIYIFRRDPAGHFSLPFSTPQIRDIFSIAPEEVENDFGPILRVVFAEDTEPFLRSIEKSAESLSAWEFEFRITSADRGLRWISAHSLPRRLPDGTIIWHGFATDVTDRKLAEERIAESEEKFRRIAERIPDIVVRFDRGLRHLYVSPAVEKYTGIPAEYFVGKTNEELGMPPESVAIWNEHFKSVFESKEAVTFEFGYSRGDRDYTFSATFSPEFEEDGSVSTIIGVSHDITDRKGMEEELKRSEARFRSYFELPILGVAITSPEKGWLEVNDRACALLGYPREELRGITWAEITHPDDLASDVAQFERMLRGEIERYSMDKRFIRKDGEAVWVNLAVGCVRKNDGAVDFIVALLQDITDRKRAEDALRESEERFRKVFDSSLDGLILADAETGKFTMANPAACRMLGRSQDDMLGLSVEDIHPKEELPRIRRLFEEQARGESSFAADILLLASDGSVTVADMTAAPVVLSGRKYLLGCFRDVTWKKKLEEERERVWNYAVDMICVATVDGRFKQVNPSFPRTLGWTEEELLSRPFLDLVHPDDVDSTVEVMKGLSSGVRVLSFENRYRCKDGSWKWIAWNSYPLAAEGLIFAVARDVTENKRAREELLSYSKNLERMVEERTRELDQARVEMFAQAKLSAMGRMGAGLAHQLNSPLGGATLLVDGLIDSLGNGREHAEALKHVRAALDNMHNIVECMLTLSMLPRRGRVSRAAVDLSKAIGSILDLALHDCTGRGIEISRKLADRLPTITARPGELDQIFLNLVNNAVDAMPSGGKLTVESKEADGVVEVRVSDTGEGIAPENLERIFEPFFTTRRSRRGVGLGLPVVREIIERYGGTISVESEVGKGTAFTVRIPAVGLKDEETPSEK